jgi:hypothetical protein
MHFTTTLRAHSPIIILVCRMLRHSTSTLLPYTPQAMNKLNQTLLLWLLMLCILGVAIYSDIENNNNMKMQPKEQIKKINQ